MNVYLNMGSGVKKPRTILAFFLFNVACTRRVGERQVTPEKAPFATRGESDKSRRAGSSSRPSGRQRSGASCGRRRRGSWYLRCRRRGSWHLRRRRRGSWHLRCRRCRHLLRTHGRIEAHGTRRELLDERAVKRGARDHENRALAGSIVEIVHAHCDGLVVAVEVAHLAARASGHTRR